MVNYNNKALQLAKYAIMFAVIFVAMMLDKAISIIPIPFSMAVCVIMVTLSFCFYENRWSTAVLSGLFFGVASFIKEFIWASPLLGQVLPPTYWPFVTIPSRILMTTAAFGVYRIMLALTKKMSNARKRQITCIVVAVFVGLVVNTIAFITSIYTAKVVHMAISGETVENTGVFALIYAIMLTNILPEYAISLASVSFIVLGVRKGMKLGIDGNNWKNTDDVVKAQTANADGAEGQTQSVNTESAEKQISDSQANGESGSASDVNTEAEKGEKK